MRVGVYIPSHPPKVGGGYTFEQEILETLMELSQESHHTFTVFSPSDSMELNKSLPNHPYVNFYNIQSSKSYAARLFRRIRRLLDWKGKYLNELNHAVEETGMDCMWLAAPSDKPVNMPYIATIWDLQHRLQPWFPEVGIQWEWQLREGIYSDLIRRATYLITGNKAGKAEISSFYQIPEERIRILPLPTPTFTVKISPRHVQSILEKHRLSPGFLFYPAQFWPHKNHANLLLALKILHDKYNAFLDLVLVGSEKGNNEYVRKLAQELGIERKVHFLGFVPREELIALYQSAFALTFLTFFGPENFPPLEAFGLGCPVIASAVQGAEEQLGDSALLVNPCDPEAIANAVKYLMDNPDKRSELIEGGYKRASGWTAKDFMRSVFAILNEFEAVRRAWKSDTTLRIP